LFLVLPPLLSDISRDLGASLQSMGLVSTLAFLLYGAGALIGGPLSDRLGGVRVSMLSLALSGGSALLFLLARDLLTFGVGLTLMAFWASFYHPTSNNLISSLFTERTAEAMGIHGAAGSIGQILTPTAAYLVGAFLDWRLAYAIFGALSILSAFSLRWIQEGINGIKRNEAFQPLKLFKAPNLWILLLYNVLVGLFYRGVELFFPTFLSLNRGFSGGLAALSTSLILLFGVLGQYLGGRGADRYGSEHIIFVSSIGVLAGMLILLLSPMNIAGVMSFIILFGAGYYAHQPAMTSLMGVVSPRELRGTAYGIMFFFTFGLGSVSTTLVGYLAERFNLELAFWFMTLIAAITLATSSAILRIRKGDRS
ncbi:MFS transporter, partial [Candidatus Bathyarchaeota archaeon]|nr:MFS transporter [Candidatus Bathyarchaeota archaeon]